MNLYLPLMHNDNDDQGMSKYGVEQDARPFKRASGRTTCPLCGRSCEEEGDLIFCPVHGSAPFEKR